MCVSRGQREAPAAASHNLHSLSATATQHTGDRLQLQPHTAFIHCQLQQSKTAFCITHGPSAPHCRLTMSAITLMANSEYWPMCSETCQYCWSTNHAFSSIITELALDVIINILVTVYFFDDIVCKSYLSTTKITTDSVGQKCPCVAALRS